MVLRVNSCDTFCKLRIIEVRKFVLTEANPWIKEPWFVEEPAYNTLAFQRIAVNGFGINNDRFFLKFFYSLLASQNQG